ncbi:hypothetical protein D3C79_1059850 [compost metagenome]
MELVQALQQRVNYPRHFLYLVAGIPHPPQYIEFIEEQHTGYRPCIIKNLPHIAGRFAQMAVNDCIEPDQHERKLQAVGKMKSG